MSFTTLLDKIAGRHQKRQQSRKADYRSLVTAIADAKEPDPELVDQILVDNDKTLEDLRTAVELLTKRRELRRAVDQQPKLLKEREQIDKQLKRRTPTSPPPNSVIKRQHTRSSAAAMKSAMPCSKPTAPNANWNGPVPTKTS